MTEDQINHWLWQIDPMNTGCNVNEGMEDEYACLAREIYEALHAGMPPRQAVLQAFDRAFWDGCLLEEHRQPALNAVLRELERSGSGRT